MENNNNSEKTRAINVDSDKTRTKKEVKLRNLTPKQKKLLDRAATGLAGVSFGALLVTLMGFKSKNDPAPDPTPGPSPDPIPIYPEAPFSDVVTDDMSFDEAFAAARKDVGGGGGFFEWKGNTYNTYYKEEWDALSPEEKNDFFASIDQNHDEELVSDEDEILNILRGDEEDAEDYTDLDDEDIVINEDEDEFIDIDDEIGDDEIVVIDDPDFDDEIDILEDDIDPDIDDAIDIAEDDIDSDIDIVEDDLDTLDLT